MQDKFGPKIEKLLLGIYFELFIEKHIVIYNADKASSQLYTILRMTVLKINSGRCTLLFVNLCILVLFIN